MAIWQYINTHIYISVQAHVRLACYNGHNDADDDGNDHRPCILNVETQRANRVKWIHTMQKYRSLYIAHFETKHNTDYSRILLLLLFCFCTAATAAAAMCKKNNRFCLTVNQRERERSSSFLLLQQTPLSKPKSLAYRRIIHTYIRVYLIIYFLQYIYI